MPRWKRAALAASAALALYALLGFVVAPPILRSQLESRLSSALRRPVRIEAVRLNPFTLSAAVRGIEVGEREAGQRLLSVGEFYVDVQCSSVWRQGLVVRELRLQAPHLRIVREGASRYNVSDLLVPSAEPDRGKPSPLRFAIGNIQLQGGEVDFLDRPVEKTHELRDLSVTLPFLSNFPAFVETFTKPSISMRVNGKPFAAQGETKPFADSLETLADLELRDVDVPYYLPYAPLPVRARIPSARFGAKVHVAYAQHRGREPTLSLSGALSLTDVAVDDSAGRPLLRLPLTEVTFGPLELFARTLKVQRASIEGLIADLARDAAGSGNWADLIPDPTPGAQTPPEPKAKPGESVPGAPERKPFAFSVDELRVAASRITFSDGSLGRPFRTLIAPLELTALHLTNARGEQGSLKLSLRTDAAEEVFATAALSLSPVRAEGQISIAGVPLARYAPYYRRQLLVDLAGRLGAATHFTVEPAAEHRTFRLGGAGLTLRGFSATRPGQKAPFASLPAVEVAEAGLDLSERRAVLGRMTVGGGKFALRRGADGAWNVEGLLATAPKPPSARGQGPEPPTPPWVVDLQRLALGRFAVAVDDDAVPRPVHLEVSNLAVEGSGLTTARGRRGKLSVSAAVNRRGRVTVKGSVGLQPVAAALDVTLRSLELAPFQGYLEPSVQALLTSGALETSGTLSVAQGRDGKTVAAYRGEAQVTRFAAAEPATGDPLFSFGALSLQGLDLAQSPPAVTVRGVSLTDFDGFVTVERDGTLNLHKALQPTEAAAPRPDAPRPAEPATARPPDPAGPARPKIEVGTITLQGGKVHFSDQKIRPSYTADFDDLGGRVSGLTSLETGRADVALTGRIDGNAAVEINGKVNPLSRDPFVDLKLSVRGVDLSPATPYSSRYAGYTIEKGKLFLDVRYRIGQRRIDAQNVVVLDQLTFGEKVESPQATKLPVRFAVALLTDREGKIKVDVPVSGSLDDPEFSYGRVIWRVIGNLVAKAVTSPFALLGSLFGGGEDLGTIDFRAGEATLGTSAEVKIKAMAKALQARPALRLEMVGHVRAEADRRALEERLFLRRLKAQKAKELAISGEDVASIDAIALTPEEFDKYLPSAFRAARFPKPKNVVGLEKALPPAEMEKLLRAHSTATDDDLRLLARRRAEAVRDALAATGQVDPARLFARDPTLPKAEEPGWSGVAFELR